MADAMHGHEAVLLIAALSLIGCSQSVVPLENGLPKSAPLSMRHDFGLVRPSSKHEHTFTLLNTSDEVWTFAAVENSCTCLASIPESEQILPGDVGRLTVAYSAKGTTRDDSTTVRVRFWETSAPKWELMLTSQVREPLTIRPESLVLNVDPGTSRDEVFEIVNYSERSWESIELKASHAWVTTQVSEIPVLQHQSESEPRQIWRVVLNAALPADVSGHFAVNLHAMVVRPELSREIPVEVRVRQPAVVIPSELFFGRVSPTAELSREAVIRFRRDVDVAALAQVRITHTLGDSIHCEGRSQNAREYVLSVILRPHASRGLMEGQINLDFEGLGLSTIVVPVRALLES